ncbi:MAG TPA: hypothetical protein VGP68_09465 [Gemmataceae bacterium]|nr:hypothetical protein [Gemmataceae bacterium]
MWSEAPIKEPLAGPRAGLARLRSAWRGCAKPSNIKVAFVAISPGSGCWQIAGRVQFLLDRDRRYVFRGGALGDMPLKIGMDKARDRETLAKSAGQVGKVDFGGVKSVILDRPIPNGLEIAVAKL